MKTINEFFNDLKATSNKGLVAACFVKDDQYCPISKLAIKNGLMKKIEAIKKRIAKADHPSYYTDEEDIKEYKSERIDTEVGAAAKELVQKIYDVDTEWIDMFIANYDDLVEHGKEIHAAKNEAIKLTRKAYKEHLKDTEELDASEIEE